jgi:nucleotide-binding universal stress UspA family protein
MQPAAKHPGPADGPFRRVIVGVDEHQGGQDAIALATQLLADGGSLTLARVYVRDAVSGHSLAADIQPPASLATHQRGGDAQDDRASGVELQRIEASSVGRGLQELARATRADLLVVGSCRRGLLGRVMIEDDTRDALDGSPCAVAIAPFGLAQRPVALDEIGVAYNGSPESQDALGAARALAATHRSRLSAFQALSVPSDMAVPGAGNLIEPPPALVDQVRAEIAALGDVEPHAAYGAPAEELALYSASLDLLVVGSRAYGPVGRLIHGSTLRQLARTARCPLQSYAGCSRNQLEAPQAKPAPGEVATKHHRKAHPSISKEFSCIARCSMFSPVPAAYSSSLSCSWPEAC